MWLRTSALSTRPSGLPYPLPKPPSAVVGSSVGGNMAAVVSLMAKDRGRPAIRFQALLWQVTDANFDTASYKEFAEGHFLTRNMMIWFWDNYTKDMARRAERYASPLRAPAEALRGLPPALVQTRAQRRAPRRGRGLRQQAERSRGRGGGRALQRPDP
jgi:acetyl esterase/lipase